jgi:hypothetical protein
MQDNIGCTKDETVINPRIISRTWTGLPSDQQGEVRKSPAMVSLPEPLFNWVWGMTRSVVEQQPVHAGFCQMMHQAMSGRSTKR